MEFTSLKQIVELGRQVPGHKVMAVPAAAGGHVVEAVVQARAEGLAGAVLIGDAEKLRTLLREQGQNPSDYDILASESDEDSARKAVALINEGSANFILKGMLTTTELLRQVVRRESNLRTGRTMSHLAFYELPKTMYHKLLFSTDGGMVNPQDRQRKADIVHNTVETLRALGYELPKAALLCCKEEVDEHMPETVDARAVRELARRGDFGPCFVEGPISYDIAMSREKACIKKFDCPYCGNFDAIIAPEIHAGNIIGKCYSVTCGARVAAIVVGARVPIVVTSRASGADTKLTSIAAAALVAARGSGN